LRGEIRVPGDKSLSHRAVLFAAMARGTSRLSGVLDSADVWSTIGAVRALGADAEVTAGEHGLTLVVTGWGAVGPTAPVGAIDCGNSGTTARLLLGVLAGYDIHAVLTGDASLSGRPMRRVTAPLAAAGARVAPTQAGTLPVGIQGGGLTGLRHDLAVASAQVKSALLLAATRAVGTTTVCEPAPSRDHTERLLPLFGVPVSRDADGCLSVTGPASLRAADFDVPGDPSSAAFLVAAALLVPGSDVVLPNIALNPTRAGFLRVLTRMGATIEVNLTEASAAGTTVEPTGTLCVRHGPELTGTTVTAEEVPALIDEVPVLAVVAAVARGTTRFEGVGELRVKESDRLGAVVAALQALGASADAADDTLVIHGPTIFSAAALDSHGDHRLAMAYAVAGLASLGEVTIDRFEAIDVSYPGFPLDLDALLVGGATG
jgi:3-phosphoshikimate 1-carboxyvinyltransferase